MRWLIFLCLVAIGPLAQAGTPSPLEERKIEYLIAAVESLEGAEFIRNGSAYDGKAAADHLRLKLKNAGSKITSADDFIRLCASSSSVSGQPYQIRFADGHTVTSEAYLRQRLSEFQG